MNKTIKKLTVTTLACVALRGTTMAAPHHGGRGPQPAPIHHRDTSSAPKSVRSPKDGGRT